MPVNVQVVSPTLQMFTTTQKQVKKIVLFVKLAVLIAIVKLPVKAALLDIFSSPISLVPDARLGVRVVQLQLHVINVQVDSI